MSEHFPGGTFAHQKVTPSEDAAVRSAILGDGILSGCSLSYSGTTLTMGAGLLFVSGRVVRHPLAQHWAVAGASSGYARLVLTVDLSRMATSDEFDQVVDSVEYATAINGFKSLIQEKINSGGTRYQIAVCVVSLGASGITGIVHAAASLGAQSQALPTEITSLEALDSLLQSGQSRLNIQAGSATVGNINFSRATVLVEGYDATNARQTLSLIGSSTKAVRSCEGGTWKPWAVENPPMMLGLEYRTTELWDGKNVYVKRIAYAADSFTAQNLSFAHNVSGMDVCISASVLWRRTDVTPDGWRQLPATDYLTGNYDGHVEYVDAENIRFRLGSDLQNKVKQSADPVYVTLKYTKK